MNSLKTRFVKILTMPRVIDSTPEETADYLIGLALEEAARVVRRMPSPSSDWMAEELLRALGGHANPVPAAIRALKEDGDA